MDSERKGYVELIMYSVCTGAVGVLVKLMHGLDAATIVFFRALIATAFIFLVCASRKKIAALNIISPFRTALVGILQGISLALYIGSFLQTPVANAALLLYTAPFFSLLLAHFVLREQIQRQTIVGMICTTVGILFVLDPRSFSLSSSETIGNLMALGAGFFYASMAIAAKPVAHKKTGYYIAFWQYLVITVLFIPFIRVDSPELIIRNWWQLLLIGTLCTGIAFTLFMEGIRKVPGQKIFIVTALEPLIGTLLAFLILQEQPTAFTMAGAVLIFYGIYTVTKKSAAIRTISEPGIPTSL